MPYVVFIERKEEYYGYIALDSINYSFKSCDCSCRFYSINVSRWCNRFSINSSSYDCYKNYGLDILRSNLWIN